MGGRSGAFAQGFVKAGERVLERPPAKRPVLTLAGTATIIIDGL